MSRNLIIPSLLVLAVAHYPAHAVVINVPADQPTIQAAINAAVSGVDEVVVAPGTYVETIDFIGKAITLRSSGGADVTTIALPPLPGDLCENQVAIAGEGLFDFYNDPATSIGPDHAACDFFGETGIDHDLWYCWTSPCDGTVRLETCGLSSVDTKIAVYDGCTCPADDSTLLACNDDDCDTQSSVEFVAVASGSYLLRIGTYPGSSGGSGQFQLECLSPPRAETDNAAYGAGHMRDTLRSWVGSVVTCTSGEGPDTVLEGFTITGGRGSTCDLHTCGGGMHIVSSDPTVTNCSFVGNTAERGGGMYNSSDSNPTVTNCTFSANLEAHSGGGMYNISSSSPTVTNCSFSGNSAVYGGGMYNTSSSSPTVTNCSFVGNTAGTGGGMDSASNCSPTVTNCSFVGNTAAGGGGMYGGSDSTVTNCTFRANSASWNGGGMKNGGGSPTVTNCSFVGNTAPAGGGMYNDYSDPTVTNCTFSANSATEYGGGMGNRSSDPRVTSCILWGDMPDEIGRWGGGGSTALVSHSDVQGGLPVGTTDGGSNADTDPQFVDADGPDDIPGTEDDNLRLQGSSLCINAGDNSAIPPGVTDDLDGNPRIQDGTVDMGAYEFGGGCPKAGSGGACPQCDLNESGLTEGLDIAIITSSANFGLTVDAAAEPCADVNGSGIVEGLDVAVCTSSACFGL